MIIDFIWNGRKHKIKQSTLTTGRQNGGLQAPDVHAIFQASKINWVKRYISGPTHLWKFTFQEFCCLNQFDPIILFKANYDDQYVNHLARFPSFYKECLKLWAQIGNTKRNKCNFIWYNKEIRIGNKCVYYKLFNDIGIQYIQDLFDEYGNVIPFNHWKTKGLEHGHYLQWAGLLTAVKKFKLSLKENSSCICNVCIEDIGGLKCKTVYESLIGKYGESEMVIPRINKYVNVDVNMWSKAFGYLYKFVKNTILQEFQYKFYQDILVNNYWLSKWKIKDNSYCLYCKNVDETIMHLFWECPTISAFWRISQLKIFEKLHHHLEKKDVIMFNENVLIYIIVLIGKKYIYRQRLNEQVPNFNGFYHELIVHKHLDYEIYKRNSNLTAWEGKWEGFDNI